MPLVAELPNVVLRRIFLIVAVLQQCCNYIEEEIGIMRPCDMRFLNYAKVGLASC